MTNDEYPDDWDSRRRSVYKRDDYECRNCGSQGGYNGNTELHAHHVVPKSRGGTHRKSNLITVCDSCHSNIHGYPIGKRAEQVGTDIEIEIEPNHIYFSLAISSFLALFFILTNTVESTFSHPLLTSLGLFFALAVSGFVWYHSVSAFTPYLDG